MSITQYLSNRGCNVIEGYSQQVPQQVNDLIALTAAPNIHVMEIGFNAGHSAEVFLENNDTLQLTSFDLGFHEYGRVGKEFIDQKYRNRHTLLLGDSTVSVPKYNYENPGRKFDVIFIDGGHEYPVANADLENCMKLAHKNTIVIMDDTVHTPHLRSEWTVGPTTTWIEHVQNNKLKHLGNHDYSFGRGISWGKYIL